MHYNTLCRIFSKSYRIVLYNKRHLQNSSQLLSEGNCKKEIVDCVNSKFSEFEKYRTNREINLRKTKEQIEIGDLLVHNSIAKELFDEYIRVVNNYTLSNLINELNTLYKGKFISKCTKHYKNVNDFVLFKVKFRYWYEIEADGAFIDRVSIHKRKTSPIDSNNIEYTLKPEPNGYNLTKAQRYLTKPGIFYYKKPVIPIHKTNITLTPNPDDLMVDL